MKYLFALAMACCFSAMASEQDAYTGVAVDAATSAAAIGAGGLEVNPLGFATIPLRIGVMEYAKTLPREESQPLMDAITASGWGAAANNLLVLAGAGVVAPLFGIVVGYTIWEHGETEREFWRLCAIHQQWEEKVVHCRFNVE